MVLFALLLFLLVFSPTCSVIIIALVIALTNPPLFVVLIVLALIVRTLR